jgi:hypothetical protein
MKTRFVALGTASAVFSAIFLLPDFALADITISASNNATVQAAGPRTGANGKSFFNMEGSSNGSFASFGVVDFQTPAGVAFGPGGMLSLTLTQANAAFTTFGQLAFYLSTDTTTSIDPGTSPLAFDASASDLPTGLGSQLNTKYLLGSGTFTEVANGHQDIFSFTPTGAALSYLMTEIDAAGKVRLIIAPNDASVAATYAGFSNTNFHGPELTITPEPSTLALEVGLLFAMGCARRRGLFLSRNQ